MCLGPRNSIRLKAGDKVQDFGFDDAERAVLSVLRLYCQSFASPETQAWIRSLTFAENAFPPENGLQIARAVLTILQVMRVARDEGFSFSNPDCHNCAQYLTEHERQLMSAIAASRRNHRSALHANVMVLCQGQNPEDLLQAIAHLCDLLEQGVTETTVVH